MTLEDGAILEVKVTGLAKFGAFVALPTGKSGLVHISEVANEYVGDISQYLQVGQTVKVKVLSQTEDGKINLSIKKAMDPPAPVRRAPSPAYDRAAPKNTGRSVSTKVAQGATDDQNFEDRLKRFMQDSDSRIADNPRYAEHKQRNRRR